VLSRCVLAILGWRGTTRRHDLVARPSLRALAGDMAAICQIALPAVLTNLATPVGSAYVTRTMAAFGSDAVAGQATIDRISPVAFGLIYALTGAVGPILAQNAGAGRPDRVRETLRDSFIFVLATVLVAWGILAAAQTLLVRAFSASGVTAELVQLFCSWLAAGFLFTGALFVANAAFNNLGYPVLSPAALAWAWRSQVAVATASLPRLQFVRGATGTCPCACTEMVPADRYQVDCTYIHGAKHQSGCA
jgi:Na+-driven multidrug efflux pump